ncbi:hypothetical protein B0H10DRAFT_176591 [Mycena sp. CBHHK59/15]|nr:hypothetical protein B0H10DRAFT_176591 [Mycena sp. CBHHK59/15]
MLTTHMTLRIIRVFRPSGLEHLDWLATSISIVKSIGEAGSLAPFPYIHLAAGTVVKILEGLQTVKTNGEDFEELAKDIVSVVVTIRNTILEHPRAPASHVSIKCNDLVKYLLQLEMRLNEIRRKNRSLIYRYLFSSSIRSAIAQERDQIKRMMFNFQTMVLLDVQLSITERLPATVDSRGRRAVHDQFRLVDAMNVEFSFPVHLYPTYQHFAKLLPSLFLDRVGRNFVEDGAYELIREGDSALLAISDSSWREKVTNGSTILMNIVLKQSNTRQDSRQCPRCHYLCTYGVLGVRSSVLHVKRCFEYPTHI